ncbi:MAG: hypothetical protein NVS1B4_04330 [Gemmatimonadaceae bacterium]
MTFRAEPEMILATVHHRLTRDDAQIALRLIARDEPVALDALENTLRDRGIDAILDDPRLLPALISARQGTHASLTLFTYVVVRNALRGAGEQDRVLADYVASILIQFGLRDRASRIADTDDERYSTLAELCVDVDDENPQRSFLVRAHLGSYALWLSGLFPDHIEQRRWKRGGPNLDYYEEMGTRGFRLAADHRLAEEHGLVPLFSAAADRFPRLRVALNEISDTLLFPHVHTPERLMRQVRDEARWRIS